MRQPVLRRLLFMGPTYAAVAPKTSDLLAVESTLTERANRIVHIVIRPSLADGLLMEYKDIRI